MQYIKKEKNNIIFNLIDTDRFKTNVVKFSFTEENNGKDNPYSTLLKDILIYNTKKYNSKIKFVSALENLYDSVFNVSVKVTGKIKTIDISISYINSKYLEENIDKQIIDMLFEVIFNPNIVNDAFDSETFKIVKTNIINTIKRRNEFPVFYSVNEFLKICCDKTPTRYSLSGEIKDYDDITEKKLYNYYKKILDMNLDVFIAGDFDKQDIFNYINKKLNKYNFKREQINNIYVKNPIKEKIMIKKEKKGFNQSQLLLGYKFDTLTEYERHYILPIYSTILGGDINSLLFKTVREENGLCYGINTNTNRYENFLAIKSGINKENYELVLKLIKKCVKDMRNKETVSKLLILAKNNINTSLNTFYDDGSQMLNYAFLNIYDSVDDVEKKKEIFKNIKVEEVLELNNKIKLDTIYFLEGEKE